MTEPHEALLPVAAGLAAASQDLVDVGRDLYHATVMSRFIRWALFTILGAVLILLVGLFVVAIQNRTNGNVVRDCTQASGACYRRNTEQTAKLVASLVARDEASAYCARHASTQAAFRSCITGYLRNTTRSHG